MKKCRQCGRDILYEEFINRGTGLCLRCASFKMQLTQSCQSGYYERWRMRINSLLQIASTYLRRHRDK